jgi:hypothetical protein
MLDLDTLDRDGGRGPTIRRRRSTSRRDLGVGGEDLFSPGSGRSTG